MTSYTIYAIITAIVIPFFAPLTMDCMAGVWVEIMNRTKHKPTWVVGTRFKKIILQNSAELGTCWVYSKTWKYVILKELEGGPGKPGYIRMKKRELMQCTCIEMNEIRK